MNGATEHATPTGESNAGEAAVLASELRLAVHRLTRRLRAQRPRDGLTLTQLSTLVSIWRDGPMTAGEVATREGVKPPSATRVIAALESQRLISRETNPADGRQVRLAITGEGSARVQADLQARDAWLARHVGSLDDADRELLQRTTAMLNELSAQ